MGGNVIGCALARATILHYACPLASARRSMARVAMRQGPRPRNRRRTGLGRERGRARGRGEGAHAAPGTPHTRAQLYARRDLLGAACVCCNVQGRANAKRHAPGTTARGAARDPNARAEQSSPPPRIQPQHAALAPPLRTALAHLVRRSPYSAGGPLPHRRLSSGPPSPHGPQQPETKARNTASTRSCHCSCSQRQSRTAAQAPADRRQTRRSPQTSCPRT